MLLRSKVVLSKVVLMVDKQAEYYHWLRKCAWALLMAVSLTLFFMNRPAVGKELADGDIRQAIQRHVASETDVSMDRIDIRADDGIVILSGSVKNLLQKTRVRQITESIRGVRSVVDTIVVEPVVRENEAIARDVRDNLSQTPPDRGLDVTVSVDNGIVTLKGVADSWVLSRLAVYQAMSIKGVSEVVNQIDVKTRLKRDDTDIASDVKRRLAADLYVDDALIEATAKDGRVTLEGIVGTAAEKRRAVENAWIAGVDAVDDRHLMVDWREKDRMRRRSPYIRQTDQTILQAVEDALLMDPRVNAHNPHVSVTNGEVTLSGAVDLMGQKVRAENIASQVEGVLTLENGITVKAKTDVTSDADMKAAIVDELFWSPYVDSDRIEVTVKDGQALLEGSAASRFVAHTAVQNGFEGGAKTVKTKLVIDDGSTLNELFREETYQFHPGRIFSFRP